MPKLWPKPKSGQTPKQMAKRLTKSPKKRLKTALKSNLCFHGVSTNFGVDAISFFGLVTPKQVF
jgi:hypothetical protein